MPANRAKLSSWQSDFQEAFMSNSLWHDLRFAVRSLNKARTFALLAIMALALGIGSTTAIFNVIQNTLLDPFPYRDSKRIVVLRIHDLAQSEPGGREVYSKPEFFEIQKQNHVFEGVMGESGTRKRYSSADGSETLSAGLVTPCTLQFLGMTPIVGRTLTPDDFRTGAPSVFVMEYKTWLNQFGRDPNVLNKTFVLNGEPYTLVGIVPPRFALRNRQIWLPVQDFADPRFRNEFFLMARLKPGITTQQAAADLDIVFKRPGPHLSRRLSKALHRASDNACRTHGGRVQLCAHDSSCCSGLAALDRLWQCGQSPSGASHRP